MADFKPHYSPPKPQLWQGRKDSLNGERYFQHVSCLDVNSTPIPKNESSTCIIGFCSDEGVRRNLGRQGAKNGPDAIRQQLAKLACHNELNFLDLGNISCDDENLENAQQSLGNLIHQVHEKDHQTIILGGGHETAWGHFQGLASLYPKIGIINFDAHFDIRPLHNQQGSSGTPFTQIKSYCDQNNRSFDYCCLGIQSTSNTESLFERAEQFGISYLTADQIQQENLAWQTAFLDDFLLNHDAIYLSICLDVLDESFAPGVSAPQSMGLAPWHVLPLLKYIQQSGKVVSLDIVELSPPYDINQKTARLAAVMLAQLFNTNI